MQPILQNDSTRERHPYHAHAAALLHRLWLARHLVTQKVWHNLCCFYGFVVFLAPRAVNF